MRELEEDGWEVMKRGWPDFLAVKDGKVRMIEVKPRSDRRFSPQQKRVAEVLALLGVTVELWSPPDVAPRYVEGDFPPLEHTTGS